MTTEVEGLGRQDHPTRSSNLRFNVDLVGGTPAAVRAHKTARVGVALFFKNLGPRCEGRR